MYTISEDHATSNVHLFMKTKELTQVPCGLRADEAREAKCALRDVLRRVHYSVAEGHHLTEHSAMQSLLGIATNAAQAAYTCALRAVEQKPAMHKSAIYIPYSAQR